MSAGSRRIHQHWSPINAWYRLCDAACIAAGWAFVAPQATSLNGDAPALVAAAVIAFLIVAEISGLYRTWRGVPAGREIVCALATWAGALLALLALGFAIGWTSQALARAAIFGWLAATAALTVGTRLLVRSLQRLLRAKGLNTRRFAIVGVNELGFQLARNIESSAGMGLKLVGFFDDRPAGRTPELPQDVGQCVGTISQLVEQARAGEIDIIYLTFPMRAEDRLRGVLARLGDTTASVYIVPDFFVFELLHSRWTTIGGLPAVSVFENPFYGVDGMLKRISDVVLAAVLLALAALPMAIIAVLIKLTSRGPVFFRQKRYGLDGREILVWKFRSMRVCEHGDKFVQATKNDPRVTPLGRILRKTSLDELPQLFNVLDGSMSLVGPRPHPNAHNEQFRSLIQGYMLRHKVKPGITGLAQVNGWRGETETLEKMQKRIECDHQYIRDWSLWMDLKILLKTVLVVLSHQNAY